MQIAIQDIVTLNAQGQRLNNEDRLFPADDLTTTDDRLFMVCDGVGGNAGGEKAAELVCRHFSEYLLQQGDAFPSKALLSDALCYTEQRLDEYVRAHPSYAGMATTLALLYLTSYGAVIAWAGDSRVIQIREGRVLRQTRDHSLVNALVDYGEITPQEAAVHPKKNVILRAVSGTQLPAQLDVLYIDDLMPGDYFMLCTDGVVEGVGDKLPRLFAESFSLEQIRYDIDHLCRRHTADNYSMILLQIGQVAEIEAPPRTKPGFRPGYLEEAPVSARVDGPEPTPSRPSVRLLVSLLAAFLLVVWWWYSLPVGLQVMQVAGHGVLIRDDNHKVLIDAFPLSDRVREQQMLSPVRQKMFRGIRPFDEVSLFLVSHRPNVEVDSLQYFLENYLAGNPNVQLHPQVLREQIENGRLSFPPLTWNTGELAEESRKFIEHLPNLPTEEREKAVPVSVFLLRMNDKILLYAGDPGLDPAYLAELQQEADYILINEWTLRTGLARRLLLSRFSDRQMIVLPSTRPMNNRQREEIRTVLAEARYLTGEMRWLKIR